MPFDVLEKPKLTSLIDCLTHLGIAPVPMKVLEAHKKAQVRANPPSLILQPRLYFGLWLLESAILFGINTPDDIPTGILTSLFCGFITTIVTWVVIMCVSGMIGLTVTKKAQWQENTWPSHDTPEAIREMAQAIFKVAPSTKILYGELTQSNTVLDPYVVVQWTKRQSDNSYVNERHCLGIWDGKTIIALADWQRT